MKRIFTFCLTIGLLGSCAPKMVPIPIKGQYPETPMTFTSTNSIEKVWDKLIDVFAQKGLAIKLIDKSSGLIISERSKLTVTTEDANGKPWNSTALLVVPKYKQFGKYAPVTTMIGPYNNQKEIKSDEAFGEWNVRLKQAPEGGTLVNVNINNITYDDYSIKTKITRTANLDKYKSTGVFEKLLYDLIK